MKEGGLLRRARRVVVAVIGGTLLLVGIAMLVLPGPALIVIPAALALLATEFMWARRLLRRVKDSVRFKKSPR
jgi:tellurite resistance protein TerC